MREAEQKKDGKSLKVRWKDCSRCIELSFISFIICFIKRYFLHDICAVKTGDFHLVIVQYSLILVIVLCLLWCGNDDIDKLKEG